jgi:hypothetical protein
MYNKKGQKSSKKYECNFCDYITSHKSQLDRHLITRKHKNNENTTNIQQNTTQKVQYNCECGKNYNHRASLYNHKKLCRYQAELNLEPNYTELVIKLINENQELKNTIIFQNKELQKTISELIPKIGNNNNNINQKFNINVFLNEQCKDALTMEQFINKIEVSLSNLMLTKNKGINEGISNIFIENMNKLSLYERPIHCTDAKRETMYIKSEGLNGESPKWEKDDNNVKVRTAIKRVTHLQHKNINTWIDKHPDWENKSDLQDEYLQIVKKCTDDINESKVIKRICDACVCSDNA